MIAWKDRWHRLVHNEQVLLGLLALTVGIVVAYVAILFRLSIGAVQWLGYGFSHEQVYSALTGLPWWLVLAVPTAAGLFIGLYLKFVARIERVEAVSQVIEAVAVNAGRMRLRDGLHAAVISVVSLGAGGSAGREGPMVHAGATVAAQIAARLGLSAGLSRTVLGCGVASAVAASFNAPIAGMFFALEVVIGHYALSAFTPVVIASVAGTVITRIHLGAEPAFVLAAFDIVSAWEFPAFVLLGVVCAIIAMIFMWSIMFASDVVDSLRVPDWTKPVAGGLAVGAIGVEFPHIMGVGYEATDAALKELLPLWLLIGLIALKTLATAVTLGCRWGGGVFSPSLFLGAMTGGAFGLIASGVFPELAASHGAYAIIGMSALAAAVLGAPISTILIVFELTGDYEMTIGVMAATATAAIIVQQVLGRSFFHWQLQRRGLNLQGGRARHLLNRLDVSHVLAQDHTLVQADTNLADFIGQTDTLVSSAFLVVDRNGSLLGPTGFADVKEVAWDTHVHDLVKASDVARLDAPVLLVTDSLEAAIGIMDSSGEDHIAVVDDPRSRHVVGIVHHRDVLRAYNKALLQAHAEEHDDGAASRGGRA